MSIRYKIALLFSSLVTLLFVIISVVVYFYSVTERKELFERRLKNRAHSTARVYVSIADSNYALLRKIDATPVASLYSKSIVITGFNDQTVYSYSDKKGDSLLLPPESIEQAKLNGEYSFTINGKEAVALHYSDSTSNFIVAVAAADYDGIEYSGRLREILYISLILSILLSFISGIVFARSLIKPIAQITSEVTLISSRNLSRRIKMKPTGDELTALAGTFNDLLDRMQDAFSTQRLFISNASHELSTPLTSVSSQLDVALQKKRTQEEYETILSSIKEDIQHLQLLTHSLLDIAKAGSQGAIDLTEVRIDEVLFRVVADVQNENNLYTVLLNFEQIPDDDRQVTAFGNSNLLYMAFKNVIENGCKYSSDRQASVVLSFSGEGIFVRVTNAGSMIAGAEITDIFQPFYRAATALEKPGFGLGLTLAKQIVSLHKGYINVESTIESGTIFTIQLPCFQTFTRV